MVSNSGSRPASVVGREPEYADKQSVDGLTQRLANLESRVRYMEKQLDTLGSPWWKRIWFRIDGYAPWWVVNPQRSWRPWHK